MAIKFLSGQTITGSITVSANVQAATFNSLAINTTGVNNVANQIVRTESNGYANFGWINSVSGNHTGSITRITASNDAYLRYVTPAQFRTGVTDGFYAPSSTVSGVTSVATGNGLTGGTIISTGTLSMSGSYTGTFTSTALATNNIITTAGSLIINDPLDQNSNLIIAGRYDLGATTLSFRSGHGGNSNVWDMATILVEDDTNYNGRIMFRTSPTGYGNTPTTKMTIRSSGAIAFGTNIADYGSSGQVLRSNGNASPTWVDGSTVIGGPYVTLGTAQTITANKTFSTLTSFTASESVRLKGIRGQFTNEFMHLYNKVGIGNPAGWGQGETSTPNQGLSTYGAGYFAYGTGAASTFLGDLTVSKGTPIIKALNTTNNHYLFIAADASNSFMRSDNNLLLQVDGGNVTALTFDNVGSATFSGYTYFPNYLFHAGDTNTRIFFETGKITLRGDTGITLDGNTTIDGGIKVNGPGSYNTIKSTNDYTLGFNDSNNVNQWWIKAYTNGAFALHENGLGDKFTIAAGGNVQMAEKLAIGATSPQNYRLQLGNSGSLVDSIAMGNYAVAKNTRQYIGYTRADSGLFESSGNGDTPSTVLGGVVGIRIVNTTGTLASSQADNSVQLLTHIYNGGSRVALHARYDGNVGIGTTLPVKRLHVKNGTSGASNYGVPGIAIENDTNVSLQFLGGASHQLGITFSDPTTVEAGFIYYNTSSNNLQLKAQNDIIFTQTGNVGIGLTAPSSKLQVGDRLDAETITVGGFYAAGGGSLKFISGYASVPSYTWTTGEILATDDGNFNGRIEFKTGDTGRLGPTIKMVIKNNGRVGIGDTTPSYALDVAGTIRATGDVIAYSDVRVKENIKTIDNSLEKVSKLRGVEFNKIGEDIKSIGVIAQEIEKVIPEVVREDDKGMKSVAYGNITGILIEAIKELKQEIEELKKQIK